MFLSKAFILSIAPSTPSRVAEKTRNWAMLKRTDWSISPWGGSRSAQMARRLATASARAARVSWTDHLVGQGSTGATEANGMGESVPPVSAGVVSFSSPSPETMVR